MTEIDVYVYENAYGIFLTHLLEEEIVTFVLCAQAAKMRLGDVYLGRVLRFERGRAWIDIGEVRPALLSNPPKDLKVNSKITVAIERIPSLKPASRNIKGPLVSYKLLKLDHEKIGRVKQAPEEWQTYLKGLACPLTLLTNREKLFYSLKQLPLTHTVLLKTDLVLPGFVKRSWQELCNPYVKVPGGGWILIEEGETLTAIDVNTSDEDKSQSLEGDLDLFEFSKRAWKVIRQNIIHRQIGGIIVIDFPRFRDKSFQNKLLQTMTLPNATLLGFTQGGLFEITRRKVQDSLSCRLELLFGKEYIFEHENNSDLPPMPQENS